MWRGDLDGLRSVATKAPQILPRSSRYVICGAPSSGPRKTLQDPQTIRDHPSGRDFDRPRDPLFSVADGESRLVSDKLPSC